MISGWELNTLSTDKTWIWTEFYPPSGGISLPKQPRILEVREGDKGPQVHPAGPGKLWDGAGMVLERSLIPRPYLVAQNRCQGHFIPLERKAAEFQCQTHCSWNRNDSRSWQVTELPLLFQSSGSPSFEVAEAGTLLPLCFAAFIPSFFSPPIP